MGCLNEYKKLLYLLKKLYFISINDWLKHYIYKNFILYQYLYKIIY